MNAVRLPLELAFLLAVCKHGGLQEELHAVCAAMQCQGQETDDAMEPSPALQFVWLRVRVV